MRGDPELAFIAQSALFRDARLAFEFHGQRIVDGLRPQAQAQRRTRLRRPGRDGHRGRHAVDAHRAHRPPGPGQRARVEIGLDAGQHVLAPARQIAHHDAALRHRKALHRDAVWIDLRVGSHGPVEHAVLVDGDGHLRALEPHVEDQHLAAEKRRQFRIHGEALDGHRRLAVRARHQHVVECHRGKRKQPRRGIAAHLDVAPEDTARLALEGGTIVRPVDEWRDHQRRRQRQHDQPAYGDEKSGQLPSPASTPWLESHSIDITMSIKWRLVEARASPQSSARPAPTSLPGLRIPLGSSACLMARI
jgi:hypothetical protein